LVCEAFHGVGPKGTEVCHLNGKSGDNAASNLAWGTRSENVQQAIAHGTHRYVLPTPEQIPRGERSGTSKLTDAIVLECRRRHASGESGRKLAKEHGITSANMSAALRGQTWGHLGAADAPQLTDNAETIMTDVQQAVPVAGEDRIAAAKIYDLLGFGPCQHIIDGVEDDVGVVQIVARRSGEAVAFALEALHYYAKDYHYDSGDVPGHIYVLDDHGRYARAALSRLTEPARKADRLEGGDHVPDRKLVEFVAMVSRLTHTGDDGWTPPSEDDSSDIVDSLIAQARQIRSLTPDPTHTREAEGKDSVTYWQRRYTQTLARLAGAISERDDAREALQPFADWADEWPDGTWLDTAPIPDTDFTVGQLRRARAALSAGSAQ
jgi:hypothetical protein